MTRKRLEKEARKEQIKKAAIALMTERGYKKTSVQDIVDKARFSKGGFYNCYRSKDELFKEILQDSMNYRYTQVLRYKQNSKLSRKEFIVEALLDKMLDYNSYKKLFSTLIIEADNNQELLDLYTEISDRYRNYFIDFCEQEGLKEYIQLSNCEFGTFINSLILGVDVFKMYNNQKYRDMMRDIMSAYFEKIGLFE